MRESFRAYYRPTDAELGQIWKHGIVVLDANALLNLFRYTPSTRDEFLGVLEKLREKLWIPHQVGLEFHRRRLDVINGTLDAFRKVTDSLESAQKEIEATLNGYKHHPSLNRGELLDEVDRFFKGFIGNLEQKRRVHSERLGSQGDAEHTFQRVSDLFSGKVGPAFSPQELQAIFEDGERRYSDSVPPGYKDKGKGGVDQYGDLVIWKEILKLGGEKKLPVIFVTDDSKEDWWWKSGGETQGPRVELVDEYWMHSERRIHFYEPLRFLEYAKKQTDAEISRQSLEEVQEVSSAKGRAHRVLQERQAELQFQRTQALRKIERTQAGEEESFRHDERGAELQSIVQEQQSLESQLDEIRQRTNFLMQYVDVRRDDSASIEMLEQIKSLRESASTLERRLSLLLERRESIEHDLRNERGRDIGRKKMWERRVLQIQNELDEVNLALEELDD